jgi:hypothetical protein
MSYSNYLPRPDRTFLSWVINFLKYLMGRLDVFNFPQALFQKLQQEKDVFANKLELTEEPTTHTKVSVQEKNDARKLLETDLRRAIAEYLTYNHLLTDGDRQLLGLPVHKTTHTPAEVAKTFPWTKANTSILRRLSIDYGSSETSKAKPEGQHGMELVSVISDTKPADLGDLTHSYFDTRTPLVIEFTEEERGKTFWFAVRWENTRGEKGPWSEIRSAIIP